MFNFKIKPYKIVLVCYIGQQAACTGFSFIISFTKNLTLFPFHGSTCELYFIRVMLLSKRNFTDSFLKLDCILENLDKL